MAERGPRPGGETPGSDNGAERFQAVDEPSNRFDDAEANAKVDEQLARFNDSWAVVENNEANRGWRGVRRKGEKRGAMPWDYAQSPETQDVERDERVTQAREDVEQAFELSPSEAKPVEVSPAVRMEVEEVMTHVRKFYDGNVHESRATVVGPNLSLRDREKAYNLILKRMNIRPDDPAEIERLKLADFVRSPDQVQREDSAALQVFKRPDNILDEARRTIYEAFADPRGIDRKKFNDRIFSAGANNEFAVLERRRIGDKKTNGSLVWAEVFVVPGGAFEVNDKGEYVPTKDLKEILNRPDRRITTMREMKSAADIGGMFDDDGFDFEALMRSAGVSLPDDQLAYHQVPSPVDESFGLAARQETQVDLGAYTPPGWGADDLLALDVPGPASPDSELPAAAGPVPVTTEGQGREVPPAVALEHGPDSPQSTPPLEASVGAQDAAGGPRSDTEVIEPQKPEIRPPLYVSAQEVPEPGPEDPPVQSGPPPESPTEPEHAQSAPDGTESTQEPGKRGGLPNFMGRAAVKVSRMVDNAPGQLDTAIQSGFDKILRKGRLFGSRSTETGEGVSGARQLNSPQAFDEAFEQVLQQPDATQRQRGLVAIQRAAAQFVGPDGAPLVLEGNVPALEAIEAALAATRQELNAGAIEQVAAPAAPAEVPNHGELPSLSPERSAELMEQVKIRGGEFKGQRLTTAMLAEAGLSPGHELKLDESTTGYLSDPFEIGHGRLGVIAYIKDGDEFVARPYYSSRSQGVWRHLPTYNAIDGHYAKGYGEESTTAPTAMQVALAKLSEGRIAKPQDPDLMFKGSVYPIGTQSSRPGYNEVVSPEPKRLGSDFYDVGRMLPPERISLDPNDSPDFSKIAETWGFANSTYGQISAEVFPSHDGRLSYTFFRDERGRSWIASIQDDSPINSVGLHSEWVSGGDLTTPAFEYQPQYGNYDQSGGYGNPELQSGHYVDMYKNYLSKIPVIIEYEEARGYRKAPELPIEYRTTGGERPVAPVPDMLGPASDMDEAQAAVVLEGDFEVNSDTPLSPTTAEPGQAARPEATPNFEEAAAAYSERINGLLTVEDTSERLRAFRDLIDGAVSAGLVKADRKSVYGAVPLGTGPNARLSQAFMDLVARHERAFGITAKDHRDR